MLPGGGIFFPAHQKSCLHMVGIYVWFFHIAIDCNTVPPCVLNWEVGFYFILTDALHRAQFTILFFQEIIKIIIIYNVSSKLIIHSPNYNGL